MERYPTERSRRKQPDDAAQARILAGELGYLALALEQAGAYIDYREQSFAAYLKEWRTQRDALLAWVDDLLPDQRSVAITWQTSFDQLGEPARRLLHRLAWFEAEPIPESLLEVSVPLTPPVLAFTGWCRRSPAAASATNQRTPPSPKRCGGLTPPL